MATDETGRYKESEFDRQNRAAYARGSKEYWKAMRARMVALQEARKKEQERQDKDEPDPDLPGDDLEPSGYSDDDIS